MDILTKDAETVDDVDNIDEITELPSIVELEIPDFLLDDEIDQILSHSQTSHGTKYLVSYTNPLNAIQDQAWVNENILETQEYFNIYSEYLDSIAIS